MCIRDRAKRTAIGSFQGSLASVSAPKLGSAVIKALLSESGLSGEQINLVVLGNVLTAGVGQNPARQAAVDAGIPKNVPAETLNVVCGSGLRSVHLAAHSILVGESEIVIAGGQENMSQAPYLLPTARGGYRMGDQKVVDSMVFDGLTDIYNLYHMGITAENVAEKYGVSREDQDELALRSQQRASVASREGKFKDEIVSVTVPPSRSKQPPVSFGVDEFIRHEASGEGLAKLRPAFKEGGTVTAGNASGINDGAAAVLMTTDSKAKELGLPILARLRSTGVSAVDPEIMGIGPVSASRKALEKIGWSVNDLDLIEANEAFAAQAVAVNRNSGFDTEKVNVNGGAIALGHPIGASGCRILVTLIHELKRRKAKRGLATLCVGGGMGVALTVETDW